MQFLFPGNVAASLLIYKLEQFKLSLYVVSRQERNKTPHENSSGRDITKTNIILEFVGFFYLFTSQETIILISSYFPIIRVWSTISVDRT